MSRVILALALLATRASADPARSSTADSAAHPTSTARVATAADAMSSTDPTRGTAVDGSAGAIADADARHALDASTGVIADADAARHAIYIDVLGKAGLWGAGYDWQFRHRFAVGAAASYYSFDGDHVTTLAPYVAAYPLERGHHRGFVQLGPTAVRRTTPSPVPEWSGMTTTRIDAELCAGYEYRNRVLVRVYAMASEGDHLAPWLGASFGWTL
jgi:hypothetical protein